MNEDDDAIEKLIVLVEGTTEEVGTMLDVIKHKCSVYVDSGNLDNKYSEYEYIIRKIKEFCNNGNKDILVIRYSGNEYIAKELGDECSLMIISISFRQRSVYYTKEINSIFSNMVDIFNKENEC